jgi:hypothetical protein
MADGKRTESGNQDIPAAIVSRREMSFGEALLAGTAVSPTNFLGQRADAILKHYRDVVGTRQQRRRGQA